MSDAFADLWNSSVPSKPVTQKTLGGSGTTLQARGANTARKTQDVFSLLSSTGTSSSSSLSTPPLPQSSSNTHLNAPLKPAAVSRSKAVPPASRPPNGGDAFGDLLSGSMATAASMSTSRMTIAERAAQAEQQRLAALQKKHQAVKADVSAWQGLDSLAGSTFTTPTQPPIVASISTLGQDSDDDWGFGTLSQAKPMKPTEMKPSLADDDWGLNDFTGSSSTSVASTATTKSQTGNSSHSRALWDLDDFMTTGTGSSRADSAAEHILLDDQFNALLGQNGEDEDDILGDLGKPIDTLPRTLRNETKTRTPTPQESKQGGSRSVSPPPHILGQIVEMGFSVQQARIALAATDTGLDVQTALDTLLSNGAASTSRRQSPTPSLPRGHRDRVREQSRPSGVQGDNERHEGNLQEQRDKLIAQASEIGLSMFNKASLFWREGKERVQKVYEERAGGSGLAGGPKKASSNLSGRPRWMTEGVGEEHDKRAGQIAYEDTDDHDHTKSNNGIARHSESLVNSSRTSLEHPATTTAEADLLSNETAFYVSPWRRGKSKPSTDSETFGSGSKVGSGTGMPRAPSPIRAIPRASIVPAPQSVITLSTQHKDRGAEAFKLGQYSEAEGAYSSAIATLPELHLLLVPLYNNRALTRLKTGDYKGAVEDATNVVEIIGSGYHPAREIKVSRADEGAAVDLPDGIVKALKRRAEALEGREKWEEAGRDWEALAAKEWAKSAVRNE
ncbi:hypothetical protein AX15_006530, partial [Amanita polypyramis BW_CC]